MVVVVAALSPEEDGVAVIAAVGVFGWWTTASARLAHVGIGLVLAGVLANVAFAAWFAGRNAVVMARGDRERIVETLSRSRITLTPAVLDALRRLTGSHVVVWDDVADAPGSSTLDQADLDAVLGQLVRIGSADGVVAHNLGLDDLADDVL